jgi:hypothetical protein
MHPSSPIDPLAQPFAPPRFADELFQVGGERSGRLRSAGCSSLHRKLGSMCSGSRSPMSIAAAAPIFRPASSPRR